VRSECGAFVRKNEETRKREAKKRIGRRGRERERERERERTQDERARREDERGSKECMGTRRKRVDRDLPVPHSTNTKVSSPALLGSESPGATGHGLTP
jgi:hypothetical protein